MDSPPSFLPDRERCAVLLLAAGEGRRFGQPKAAVTLNGMTLLQRSAHAFRDFPHKVAVLRAADVESADLWGWTVVAGGAERTDSVAAGLAALPDGPGGPEIVLIHDAARPLVSREIVDRIVKGAREAGAVIPVVPVTDTIKRVRDSVVLDTPDRSELAVVQTPQGFSRSLLERAVAAAGRNSADTGRNSSGTSGAGAATDDASLVEALGEMVQTVPGDPRNLKITRPEDLDVAKAWLSKDLPETG
ncbi:MAG: 2-C-methyl-D-erythritol 4-phosphate cytidylyltransferase [Planctomycetota bacterium]